MGHLARNVLHQRSGSIDVLFWGSPDLIPAIQHAELPEILNIEPRLPKFKET